ncbi:MAG: hypothetical protein IJ568_06780 [Bacilli bacterium]|nr:hypothetical protein [Bacilli bacterium]
MKKGILLLIILTMAVVLTGCGGSEKGDSRFDYIIKELNTAVDESIERNGGVSIVTIEGRLEQNISSARIVACGDKEFTKDVELKETSYTRNLNGYDGSIGYSSTAMTDKANINYCLVYAINARGYLNVTVKYDKDNKPVFSIPVVLNG